MNMVLLTDDYYLKSGMENFIAEYAALSMKCIHIPSVEFSSEQIDILNERIEATTFIIAIENESLLLKISLCIPAEYSHVIFMFDSPDREYGDSEMNGIYLSKKINLFKIFNFLVKCQNNEIPSTSHCWRKKSVIHRERESLLFKLLINGSCMKDVARKIDVKNKTAYVIRKRVLDQFDMGNSGLAFRMNILRKIMESRNLIIGK